MAKSKKKDKAKRPSVKASSAAKAMKDRPEGQGPRPEAEPKGRRAKKAGSLFRKVILAILAVLFLLAALAAVLAWRTEYLDPWLPANIKTMFGRGREESGQEEAGETGEDSDEGEIADEDETTDKGADGGETSDDSEDEGDTEDEEEDATADWKIYTNNKYGYSFKYPPDYTYGPCTSKPCSNFVYDNISGNPEDDYVLLQGDITTKGWPNIGITHYSTDFYNPPAGTDLIVWLKVKSPFAEYVPDEGNTTVAGLKAVKLEIPASPQAYSSWETYVLKGTKLFSISMTDISTQEAQDFYNLFLSTFKFNN